MPLIAVGLNHLTAPVALREQVAIDPDATAQAVESLAREDGVSEALILSTCNRTELYCNVNDGAQDVPERWLHQRHHLATGKLSDYLYRYHEDLAVRHIFRVATGLDSMVLGEPQILGQVKEAYRCAHAAGSLDAPLERLLQQTFTVAKRVRTDTRIGAHTVSVAFTAVRLAEQMFTDLEQACVLLIGAGDTVELAARHLADKHVRRLIVANRTLETAQDLARRHGGYAIGLADLHQHLAEADIVIASTAARNPVVTQSMVRAAVATRRRRPMFMVDIAVPRDIEPAVGDLQDVYLYGIDDLRRVIDSNRRSRENAAHEAEAIVELQVDRFMAWRRALTLRNPAVPMRLRAEQQRDTVLARAKTMLANGKDPDAVMTFLANTLTNKLLHAPSARLRDATLTGDTDLLRLAERLYDLDDDNDTRDA